MTAKCSSNGVGDDTRSVMPTRLSYNTNDKHIPSKIIEAATPSMQVNTVQTPPSSGHITIDKYVWGSSAGGESLAAGHAIADTGDTAAESGGIAAESGDIAANSGGTTANSAGTPANSGGIAAESGGITANSGGTTADSAGTTANSGDIAAESGGTTANSGGTAADSGEPGTGDSISSSTMAESSPS